MTDETPQFYAPSILMYATIYGASSVKVANSLGISATAILGCLLEEANDRSASWYELGRQNIADIYAGASLSNDSHQNLLTQYNSLLAMAPSQRLNISKLSFPLMIDLGVGNIQTFTAIRLLNDYAQDYPATDPIGLKKYLGGYPQLVDDLLDKLSPTSVKIAGLMVREAMDWGASHIANWSALTKSEKEGFSVYCYNIGEDAANQKYYAAIATSGAYVVNIQNTDIVQEYILNTDSIASYSNPSNSGWIAISKLISDDYYIGSGSSTNECFPSATNIHLSRDNIKPISMIEVGDVVLSLMHLAPSSPAW